MIALRLISRNKSLRILLLTVIFLNFSVFDMGTSFSLDEGDEGQKEKVKIQWHYSDNGKIFPNEGIYYRDDAEVKVEIDDENFDEKKLSIYASEDGGKTFKKISDFKNITSKCVLKKKPVEETPEENENNKNVGDLVENGEGVKPEGKTQEGGEENIGVIKAGEKSEEPPKEIVVGATQIISISSNEKTQREKGIEKYLIKIEYRSGAKILVNGKTSDDNSFLLDEIFIDKCPPKLGMSMKGIVGRSGEKDFFGKCVCGTATATDKSILNNIKITAIPDNGDPIDLTGGEIVKGDRFIQSDFKIDKEGTYRIKVECIDKAGNIAELISDRKFVLDKISVPAIIDFGQGQNVYVEDRFFPIRPEISILSNEENLNKIDVSVSHINADGSRDEQKLRIPKDENSMDESKEKNQRKFQLNKYGGIYNFNADSKDVDGIYIMTVRTRDFSNNEIAQNVIFRIDENGSKFKYDEGVKFLLEKFRYVKKITKDIEVYEINPVGLLESSNILVTRDGETFTDRGKTRNLNDKSVNTDSWFKYRHEIKKETFNRDGIYKIYINSLDKCSKNSDLGKSEDKGKSKKLAFVVDSTPPAVTKLAGGNYSRIKESQRMDIIDDDKISINVRDNIALSTIKVYFDDELVLSKNVASKVIQEIREQIQTSKDKQPEKITVIAEDRAGNVTRVIENPKSRLETTKNKIKMKVDKTIDSVGEKAKENHGFLPFAGISILVFVIAALTKHIASGNVIK